MKFSLCLLPAPGGAGCLGRLARNTGRADRLSTVTLNDTSVTTRFVYGGDALSGAGNGNHGSAGRGEKLHALSVYGPEGGQ